MNLNTNRESYQNKKLVVGERRKINDRKFFTGLI